MLNVRYTTRDRIKMFCYFSFTCELVDDKEETDNNNLVTPVDMTLCGNTENVPTIHSQDSTITSEIDALKEKIHKKTIASIDLTAPSDGDAIGCGGQYKTSVTVMIAFVSFNINS